jgi:hypothetical protein
MRYPVADMRHWAIPAAVRVLSTAIRADYFDNPHPAHTVGRCNDDWVTIDAGEGGKMRLWVRVRFGFGQPDVFVFHRRLLL